ncbi:hypothetical protein OAC89_04660 [Deltaproteobacteria bacterium]|nr:hypothetical protein [Deltaproteobacteria bacterium]
MIDDQDSRPFDGVHGRERVERIPGVRDSSETLNNYEAMTEGEGFQPSPIGTLNI